MACLALNALLLILRIRDRHQEHAQHLQRLAVLARRHNLAGWGLYERFLVIQDQWMADGDDLPLRALREEAQRLGQIWLALGIDTDLYLHQVMVSEGSMASVIASLNGHIELAQRLGDTTQLQWAAGEPGAGRGIPGGPAGADRRIGAIRVRSPVLRSGAGRGYGIGAVSGAGGPGWRSACRPGGDGPAAGWSGHTSCSSRSGSWCCWKRWWMGLAGGGGHDLARRR